MLAEAFGPTVPELKREQSVILELTPGRRNYEVTKVEKRLRDWQENNKFPLPFCKKSFTLNQEEVLVEEEQLSLYSNYVGQCSLQPTSPLFLLKNVNNLEGLNMYLLADFTSNQSIITLKMVEQANLLAHQGFVFFNGFGAGNSIYSPAHVQIIRSNQNNIHPRHFSNTFPLAEIPTIYDSLVEQEKLVTLIFLGNERVGIIEHQLYNMSWEDQLWYLLLGPSAIELGSNAIINKEPVIQQIINQNAFPNLTFPEPLTIAEQRVFHARVWKEFVQNNAFRNLPNAC